jgi:hypothetical protein
MIVTIHQPSYLPWIPFLEKGLRSDVYVMLDDVQFEKNSEQNRNRIKTSQGALWLTVPVSRRLGTFLSEVRIADEPRGWNLKHRHAIEGSYSKASCYGAVAPRLFELLDRTWPGLLELNLAVGRLFLEWAGFAGRIVLASELKIGATNWERILKICQAMGADTYLSGIGGLDYLNLSAFESAGIGVLFQHYQHGEYPQLFPKLGFIPRLSALDLFMNVGVGDIAREFILANSTWAPAAEPAP